MLLVVSSKVLPLRSGCGRFCQVAECTTRTPVVLVVRRPGCQCAHGPDSSSAAPSRRYQSAPSHQPGGWPTVTVKPGAPPGRPQAQAPVFGQPASATEITTRDLSGCAAPNQLQVEFEVRRSLGSPRQVFTPGHMLELRFFQTQLNQVIRSRRLQVLSLTQICESHKLKLEPESARPSTVKLLSGRRAWHRD